MKFTANGLTYEIEEVDKESPELLLRELYHFGMTNHKKQKVYLMNDISEQQKICVLRHEIAHVFINVNGMYAQETFTVEQLCEFVAYNAVAINKIVDEYFGR